MVLTWWKEQNHSAQRRNIQLAWRKSVYLTYNERVIINYYYIFTYDVSCIANVQSK